ncbi:hypothetical protein HNQ07_003808, partial [Deinococcus metalli]|nr:hypothetical protein [Deinococcus metalli]
MWVWPVLFLSLFGGEAHDNPDEKSENCEVYARFTR